MSKGNKSDLSRRERLANWATEPKGRIRKSFSDEGQQEIRKLIMNPISWLKGVDIPEGHVTPWELLIFAFSSFLATGTAGFSGKLDFLFKEWYHISPNKMSVAGIISSLWDAANDPVLGSFMDRHHMGPKQWRWIMRICAVTGHSLVIVRMLDGGLSEFQHLVVLVLCNCLQDVIGTMDIIAGQKLRAGISPYTQQRARTQVWSSVGSSCGYTISALPMLLMGLQDVFGLNDYQIIVMGTSIMLPFSILSSILVTFIRQRVDFKYSEKPITALPSIPERDVYVPEETKKEEVSEEELERRKEAQREADRKYREAKAQRNEMLAQMTYKERKEWKRTHKTDFRAKIANGEIQIDPETGEPKLSFAQSFEVVKYNKYFLLNVLGNFITVFTPSVDQTLVYRYLVPRFKIGGKEITGEIFLVIRDYIIGTPITFTKPFSRQLVNICGGPLRVIQLNSFLNMVSGVIKLAVGINKFWKLAVNMLVDAILYVVGDMSAVAGTMMNYEMLDLVELETGVRTEGVTASIDGLFSKIVTNNIGAVTGNAFLEWTGYRGGYKNTGEALPPRFVKWTWPMFTLSTVFDNGIWLLLRSFLKHTPEDAKRIEAELIALRASQEPESVSVTDNTTEE